MTAYIYNPDPILSTSQQAHAGECSLHMELCHGMGGRRHELEMQLVAILSGLVSEWCTSSTSFQCRVWGLPLHIPYTLTHAGALTWRGGFGNAHPRHLHVSVPLQQHAKSCSAITVA